VTPCAEGSDPANSDTTGYGDCARPLAQPQADTGTAVDSIAFSPDGHTLASGENDGTTRLWDLTDPAAPRPLAQLASSASGTILTAVAFSPRGHMLASSDIGATIQLWDVTDPAYPDTLGWLGQLVRGAPVSDTAVDSVAFSSDGQTLASGNDDGTIGLWDITDPVHPRLLAQLQTGSSAPVASVVFSPRGRTLASGSSDGTIRLWDLTDPAHPQPLGQALTGTDNALDSLAFSPDGHTLASGGDDNAIWLWNLNVQYAIDRICATAGGLTPRQWNQYVPQLRYQPSCGH
jgi:WD40 repeat protein